MSRIRRDIQELVGAPYCFKGTSITEGFDCLTLAREVLLRLHGFTFDLPEEYGSGRIDIDGLMLLAEFFERSERALPGALVDFEIWDEGESHCGILIDDDLGNRWVIHAASGLGVLLEPHARYLKAIRGYYRLVRRPGLPPAAVVKRRMQPA